MVSSIKTKNTLFLLSIICICLFIDLGQFFLIGALLLPLLLCFFCALIMYSEGYIILLLSSFLQCLETFCFYNLFYLACTQIVPITACTFFFKKNLYPSRLHPIILALIGIFVQIYLIEGSFLPIYHTNDYTIMRIIGTLLITICFSLTINIGGVDDNRG